MNQSTLRQEVSLHNKQWLDPLTMFLISIMKGNPRGLLFMDCIISYWIRSSGVDVTSLCRRGFFPNDLKAVIISFYSLEPPKLASFRTLIPTAVLCQSTVNLTEYIGVMMTQKLLFQGVELDKVDQESIMSEDNASICRQLIFLFHYILGLDQYKMPKQQPLTNNFTAYKRMHSEVGNAQKYKGGGFSSFAKNRAAPTKQQRQFTDKELLPISQLNDIAMFMGKGCTASID